MAERYITIIEYIQEHGYEMPDEETLEKMDAYAQAISILRGIPFYEADMTLDED